MTELMEIVALAFIETELEECPFPEPKELSISTEDEDLADDDSESVQSQQENDGGTLGRNLANASAGADGTVGGPVAPPELGAKKPVDSKRGGGRRVRVTETDLLDAAVFPYTVAAHHLIPGNASLKPSELTKYMTEGEVVETEDGKSWTIANHIGYNVNGNHNGVWLPGNYAIRKYSPPNKRRKTARPNTSPVGSSKGGVNWSGLPKLYHDDWQLNYVASACRVAGAQFHDTHETYSENVLKLLNKIETKLMAHQENCEECKKRDGKAIQPPYLLKGRLFGISSALKTRLQSSPLCWKRPWFTSDRWAGSAFSGGKPSEEFANAYAAAKEVN